MSRSIEFNEQAMELKIKNNEKIGFTKKQIFIALKEEKLQCHKRIMNEQKRISELSDQIDYIQEKHIAEIGILK